MTHKRSHRLDRLAKIYDAEILPLWSERFGRLLLRKLRIPPKAMVLDVGAGTGYPALEVLRRMDEAGRVISIDPSSAMLDVAREKAGALGGKRIFFRSESAEPRLSFADEVFDVVVSNLALAEMESPARAIADFARVCKPGGRVVTTVALAGTFDEFHDLLRESLVQLDRGDAVPRFDEYLASLPSAKTLRGWFEAAGLRDVTIEHEEYELLFRSSREFFFAPIIEYGPLTAWKEIAGTGEAMQAVFWKVKESIDTYFGDRPFALTVRVGCASGRRATDAELVEETYGMAPVPAIASIPSGPTPIGAIAASGPTGPSGQVGPTIPGGPSGPNGADGPTSEIALDTAEFELVEETRNSYVGEAPEPSDAEDDAPAEDLADILEPDSEIFTSPGGRLRRRRR